MVVSKTAPVPPKQPDHHRVERDTQVKTRPQDLTPEICPAHEVCKKLGNFYPEYCKKSPGVTQTPQRCTVSLVLLQGKRLG